MNLAADYTHASWLPLLVGALVVILLVLLVVQWVWILGTKGRNQSLVDHMQSELSEGLSARIHQSISGEVHDAARQNRQELAQTLLNHHAQGQDVQRTLGQQQMQQIEQFAAQVAALQKGLSDSLAQQLGALSEANSRRLSELRETLEKQVQNLQASNAQKLDEMRQTVDEKLQNTLEQRLGSSFKLVADRLELVHKGLGEMQGLAQGVGDLKHILSNVKTRGMFGETQLANLLEQVFAAEQYAAQVATKPGSREVVDFAVKLPGQGKNAYDAPLWLPIDAKFPTEDYERLLDAQHRADPAAADAAGKALEARIKAEARSMAEKYIAPPYTTDFAILFLPTEGLYAEVLRRPGLMELLQREYRITLAGPTTLLALLNSLQMGFRTLALEKRSSEVWQVLGAVKTEFGKFGEVLAKVKDQTQKVLTTLDSADTRNRAMTRALRNVEALPEGDSHKLLDLTDPNTPNESQGG